MFGSKKKEQKEKEARDKLLREASEKGDQDSVKLLLSQGADPNSKNNKNETPLMYAAVNGHDEVVRILLAKGADWNMKNKRGKTAVELAREAGKSRALLMLSSVNGDRRVFALLEQLEMLDYWDAFTKADVKFIDLRSFSEKDFENLGLPYAPRTRILKALHPESSETQQQESGISSSQPLPPRSAPHPNRFAPTRYESDPGRLRSPTDPVKAGPRVGALRNPKLAESYSYMVADDGSEVQFNNDEYGSVPGPNLEYSDVLDIKPEYDNDNNEGQLNGVISSEYSEAPNLSSYTEFEQNPNPPPTSTSNNSSVVTRHKSSELIKEEEGSFREINYNELIIEKEIGRGAFGVVCKGEWRGAAVAIKKLHSNSIINAQMQMEFRREAAMMQLVGNHPNIVKFMGACSKEEPFCLVSIFCTLGSLESLVQNEDIPLVLLIKMLCEASAGIIHLHYEGVIHRDIAARNVLVGESYTAYITDFGFARIKDQGAAYNTTTSSIGPVKYMAPEALKEKKYSEKSDAYSFGVLIWEIYTKKVPYEGEDLLKIAMDVVQKGRRLVIPPDTPKPLADLMKMCWDEDPSKRPDFTTIHKHLLNFHSELVQKQGNGAPLSASSHPQRRVNSSSPPSSQGNGIQRTGSGVKLPPSAARVQQQDPAHQRKNSSPPISGAPRVQQQQIQNTPNPIPSGQGKLPVGAVPVMPQQQQTQPQPQQPLHHSQPQQPQPQPHDPYLAGYTATPPQPASYSSPNYAAYSNYAAYQPPPGGYADPGFGSGYGQTTYPYYPAGQQPPPVQQPPPAQQYAAPPAAIYAQPPPMYQQPMGYGSGGYPQQPPSNPYGDTGLLNFPAPQY